LHGPFAPQSVSAVHAIELSFLQRCDCGSPAAFGTGPAKVQTPQWGAVPVHDCTLRVTVRLLITVASWPKPVQPTSRTPVVEVPVKVRRVGQAPIGHVH